MESYLFTAILFGFLGFVLGGSIVHWLHRRMAPRRTYSGALSRQLATPEGSWVEDIEHFTHTPVRPYISPDQFRNQLRQYTEKTRELVLTPVDPGPKAITKIGGVPWWPAGKARPTCAKGHAMSFIAQVLLADVPGLEKYSEQLLSFHYCDECSKEGRMSFGFGGPNPQGYDVTIHEASAAIPTDGLGLAAESIVDAYSVSFRDVEEVPGYSDTCVLFIKRPEDYPGRKSDFDDEIYPGLVHVARSKLGGWPNWEQGADWPRNRPQDWLAFVLQLDMQISPRTPWSNGNVYLFVKPAKPAGMKGEMVIQVT
jgi:hypothetical protein